MTELLNNHQNVFVFSLNLVKVLENNNLITEFIHLLLLGNVRWLHWFHRIEWLVRVWYKPDWFSEVKLLAPINVQRIPLKIKALDPILFKDLLVLLLTDIGSAETFRFEPQGLVSLILLYKAVVLRLNQKLLSYFDVLNFHGIALSLHLPLLMFELLDDSVSFLKLNGSLLEPVTGKAKLILKKLNSEFLLIGIFPNRGPSIWLVWLDGWELQCSRLRHRISDFLFVLFEFRF